jgi:hypothetical protein
MIEYQILSEGNAIIPINLGISFPVIASVQYTYPILSELTGEDLEAFINAYGRNEEIATKNVDIFSTKDTDYNSVTSFISLGGIYYTVIIDFTINAIATLSANTQTDLTGTEKDAYLQSIADSAEYQFWADRPNFIKL